MKRIAIALCAPLLLVTSAGSQDYPGCSVQSKGNAPFTSDAGTDYLSVSINGNPCYEAMLVVSIESESGKPLYQYDARFKPHVVMNAKNPELPEEAERLARRFHAQISYGRTSELPVWEAKHDYYESNHQELRVDKAYYDMLRQKDWITYTHKIHYAGWRVISFDRDKLKMVIVSEGPL